MRLSMRIISPILQITIGLLLLTLSLLLIGDLLGLVPNQKQSQIEARKTMAESLAIQVTFEVGQQRMEQATELLNIIVDHNEDILSVGLRSDTGTIVMQSDEHTTHWTARDDNRSTAEHVQVPIFAQSGRWGTLELSFIPLGTVWTDMFTGRSFAAMVLFIFVSGFIAYWLFLKRVLSELDPSSVVPDRVRSALDVLTEGLVILDTSERIVLMNASLKKKLGLLEEDLVGKHLSSLGWEMESDPVSLGTQKFPWTLLFETKETPPVTQIHLKTVNHGTLAFNINTSPIKTPDQKLKGAIVTIDDVTEIEKKNRELAQLLERLEKSKDEISRQNLELVELATRDPLTHALNRRALFEGMGSLLIETREHSDVLSCIMTDIDHFKLVNDNYGHGVGDIVIKVVAKILQEVGRSEDLVGRYGGEEFVVVLPGMSESEAVEVAERVRLLLIEERHEGFPNDLAITSSFGVSSTKSGVWDGDKLVDLADQALYVAKESGRNRVVRHSQMDLDHSEEESLVVPSVPHTPSCRVESENKTIEESETDTVDSDTKESITLVEMGLIERSGEIPLKVFDKMGDSARIVVFDRLTQALHLAQRSKTNLAVMTIYIDTIQTIKNTLSYASAEKLRSIAFQRIIETLRSSDSVMPESNTHKDMTLSHSSDSEFIAILSDIEQAVTTTRAISRVLKELTAPVEIDGNEIVMTANIGTSIYPADGEYPEVLLANSNLALQAAIKEGKGVSIFYDQEMNTLCKEELQIESQLHQALEREELYLEYQPIVSMKTGRVEKLEALIRWRHPELGMVSPDAFVEIAERVGLIKPIGAWVIEAACRQLQLWQADGHPHLQMSINLSAVQFEQSELVEDILDIVSKTGVSPESIVLELTETALLKQLDNVINTIYRLHSAGFQIALDDFGTGYSSLDYLRKLPVDWVKIDRSYMEDFPNDIHDVSIVSGLISLSHALGMRVIAEGMEQESQLVTLRDLRCDQVQGYLMSRPLSVDDVTAFLSSTDSRRMIRKINMLERDSEHLPESISLANVLNTPPGM